MHNWALRQADDFIMIWSSGRGGINKFIQVDAKRGDRPRSDLYEGTTDGLDVTERKQSCAAPLVRAMIGDTKSLTVCEVADTHTFA